MHTSSSAETSPRLSGLQLPISGEGGRDQTRRVALSLCQTTTYRWSLTDDLVHYARAGIGAIGLYRPKVEEFDEELAIDLIRSTDMAVSSVNWIGGFTGSDGNPQSEAIYDAREAMRLAAAVDAGTVAIVAGGLGRHISKHARRLLCHALDELCDEAEDRDLRLALHPFSNPRMRSRSLIRSLSETRSVIEQLDRRSLGLVLDLEELAEERDLAATIPAIAPLIHCVRLSSVRSSRIRNPKARSRQRTQRVRLGEGAFVSAAQWMKQLIAAGYRGPFEFDLFRADDQSTANYDELIRRCRSEFNLLESAYHAGR